MSLKVASPLVICPDYPDYNYYLPTDAVEDWSYTYTGTPVTIDVLANDFDAEGDSLIIDVNNSDLVSANGGTISFENNQLIYTPASGFTGYDEFYYTISDGNGNTDTAYVGVSVTPPTDAVEDWSYTYTGTPVTIDVLANDFDLEGDSLIIDVNNSDLVSVNGGTISFENNQLIYTPASGFTGYDEFYYTISDGNGNTDTAYVGVYVAPTTEALYDYAETNAETPVIIDAVANDFDLEGDSLIIDVNNSDVTSANGGTISFENNQLIYTPASGFSGYDGFYYTVVDGNGNSSQGYVEVMVSPSTDAVEDYVTAYQDTAITVDVLGNDFDLQGDSLSIENVLTYDHFNGQVTISEDQKTLVYTPNSGFTGYDYFEYTISDGNGNTDTAYVSLFVTLPTDAVEDYWNYTLKDTPVTIDVLANDTDAEGDLLQITSFNANSVNGGTIIQNAEQKLIYTPATNFTGYDSFEYSISDGNGHQDTAFVEVYVGSDEDGTPILIDPPYPIYYSGGSITTDWNATIDIKPMVLGANLREVVLGENKSDDHVFNKKSGTPGADVLNGTRNDDQIEGKQGTDQIFGRAGDDLLKGNAGKDKIRGGIGDDIVKGGLGNDQLWGGKGNDVLWDDKGDNRLNGGEGNDKLVVDFDRKNTLIGSAGADQFWLLVGDGLGDDDLKKTSRIVDFTSSEDKIGIVGNFTFDDLSFKDVSGGTAIKIDDTKLAVLLGVEASSLTEDNFLFSDSLSI